VGDDLDAAAILRDLPGALWDEVAEAVRAALALLERSTLPRDVQPFAGWRADRLREGRARAAVARAVAADARIRAAMAEVAGPHGADRLAAEARWTELVALSVRAADAESARARSATEARARRREEHDDRARRRLSEDLRAAREERDDARRRLEAAAARASAAERERDRLSAEVARLAEKVSALEGTLAEERRLAVRRQQRARQRVLEAEARARVDAGRTAEVAERLEVLAGELRAALAGPAPGRAREDAGADVAEVAGAQPAVATSGRPCVMPAGLSADRPDGVLALLRVPEILLLVDGYNVTKDARGRPASPLAEQRAWLLRVLEAVSTRFGCRPVLVFDGTDAAATAAPASRCVVPIFTSGDETADDRIVILLEGRDGPAVVVTSDGQLSERCRAVGADVVRSDVFLAAVG
jgi:predicted RNA-binding protein with PIN domain